MPFFDKHSERCRTELLVPRSEECGWMRVGRTAGVAGARGSGALRVEE